MVSATDPHGRILGFIDQKKSVYCFINLKDPLIEISMTKNLYDF
jgi:hypothetical protein